jgi:hypothetical protein
MVKQSILLLPFALLAIGATSASGAPAPCEGCTPWWHVATTARPTDMWTATSEVQELEVGSLTELRVKGGAVACVGQEGGSPFEGTGKDFCEHFTGLPLTASPTELAPKLEAALRISGVLVSEKETDKWVITTPGHFVPALEAIAPDDELGGGSASVQGGSGELVITATNLGDASVNGETTPVTIADALPEGVTALKVEGLAGEKENHNRGPLQCAQPAGPCTFAGQLPPYESIEVAVRVALSGQPPAVGAPGEATVAGGSAASVSLAQPLHVGEHTSFGVERYEALAEEVGGAVDTQAGSHPFQFTTTLDLNQGALSPGNRFHAVEQLPALPRNFRFELPPGLVGDVVGMPKCSEAQFTAIVDFTTDKCPADTVVGAAAVTLIEDDHTGLATIPVPVFNLAPQEGEPARFGFDAYGVAVAFDTALRSREGYGVTVSIANTSQLGQLLASTVTLWGVPNDPRHDASRGAGCLYESYGIAAFGTCQAPPERPAQLPFLTLPTSCTGPLSFSMGLESWSGLDPPAAPFVGAALDGCNRVPFEPQIEVSPATSAGDSPTALAVRVKVSQQASEAPAGVAESDVRSTTVTLPTGLQVNPAAAGGLEACSDAQVGFERLQASGEAVFSEGEAHCPEASKLGSVKVTTPLLEKPLEGSVYQAAQDTNPFGSLLALYVVAENKERGVRVKLAGKVEPNPSTSQLVSTFDGTPQLPFEEFDLKFSGGGKAPLATSSCGAYQTTSSIEPWSGEAPVDPTSEFDVTSGPGGSACPDPGPFAPSFTAGTSNSQARAFSPFTLKFARQDGEQTLSTVSTQMPPGLLGMLSKVQLCGEPQAKEGRCPAASQVGHVTATAGVGSEPVTLPEAGKPQDPVFLTGPYVGAPFGLSIVVPAESGPFNLGTIVVRATIHIDPATSQISVTSEPMSTRLQGIPLDVRNVEVTIDREGFMFNSTNCEPLAVSGTIGSAEGAVAGVSSHYEAANCATLPFKPSFTAFTQAKTSKVNGASLLVKVTQKPGEANIAKVELQLPKVLPSRDSTLQKACAEAQFNANPADCPAGSVIGTATARTPVLQVPLTGPAYLVSHGGAAFPDVEYVLQADERGGNVDIVLDGKTQIKKGITYSRFETVPDAPISSFETSLPEGPHSIFSTEYPGRTNLCASNLLMPITIVGQNGAVEEHEPRIEVTGCRDALSISSRSLQNRRLTLHVVVPAAGKLTAGGRGLKTISKSAGGRETLTLTVGQKHAGRLSTKVKLSFKPSKGRKLTKALSVTFTR